MSVQVSYKKQITFGIIGIVILFLLIEVIANVWWVTQTHCEFEDSETFQNIEVLYSVISILWYFRTITDPNRNWEFRIAFRVSSQRSNNHLESPAAQNDRMTLYFSKNNKTTVF